MVKDRFAASFDGVRKLVVEAAADKAYKKLPRDEQKAIKLAYPSIAVWFIKNHPLRFRDDPA